jgi:urease accessory protein
MGMQRESTVERKAKSRPGRHPREGGDPCSFPYLLRQVSWVPAFAGMTFALLMCAISNPALAHTGHEHVVSFTSGFQHPWTGLDHLLAMVAVGLWAGLNGGRALWVWPAAFVGIMIAGSALGMAGIALPLVEPGILASVIVLGLLVLGGLRVPVAAGAVLVAAFAVLHGHAHGAELPAESAAITYIAGFALATAALHGIGLGIARLARDEWGRSVVRGSGALVALAGVVLAAF